MASTYDKESSKISYYELAPSLQDMIGKMVNFEQFTNIKNLINAIRGRTNGVVITVGLTEPVHGVTKGADGLPLVIADNKAIHLHSGDQVLEARTNGTWIRHRLVYR